MEKLNLVFLFKATGLVDEYCGTAGTATVVDSRLVESGCFAKRAAFKVKLPNFISLGTFLCLSPNDEDSPILVVCKLETFFQWNFVRSSDYYWLLGPFHWVIAHLLHLVKVIDSSEEVKRVSCRDLLNRKKELLYAVALIYI